MTEIHLNDICPNCEKEINRKIYPRSKFCCKRCSNEYKYNLKLEKQGKINRKKRLSPRGMFKK